jgi:hypothetical protein
VLSAITEVIFTATLSTGVLAAGGLTRRRPHWLPCPLFCGGPAYDVVHWATMGLIAKLVTQRRIAAALASGEFWHGARLSWSHETHSVPNRHRFVF